MKALLSLALLCAPALAQSLHQFLNSPEEPDVEEEALEASLELPDSENSPEGS